VIVQDTSIPQLTLNGSGDIYIEVNVDPDYIDEQAVRSDNGFTGEVAGAGSIDFKTVGTYTLTYTYTDEGGHTVSITRTIHVQDTQSPTLTLNGSTTITLEANRDNYIDEGADWTDNYDGTGTVYSTGSFNTGAVATYLLRYYKSDTHGNAATPVSRTIVVQDTTKPVITLNGASTITIPVHSGSYTELYATVTDTYDTGVQANLVISGTVLRNPI